MRILFCDDNIEILNQLHEYVSEFFKNIGGKMPEFAAYLNGDVLLKNEQRADIAFLDVEMPGRSGIYVGARLKEINPNIKIFIVTSFPDYLDEAMRFQVFRYLSKPIDKNRLFRNLKDAVYQLNLETKEIPIDTYDGLIIKPADQIVFIETVQRKTSLHTTTEIYRTKGNINTWETKLDLPCFYSPYRSFIINMRFVSQIRKDIIILKYGENLKAVYLAKRKYSDFKNTYLLFLENTK